MCSRSDIEHLQPEPEPQPRYGYGDGGHKYDPRDGRCRWAGSGYCDGTRADSAHTERPLIQPEQPMC